MSMKAMAAKKTKRILASEVYVGNVTVEARLLANDERFLQLAEQAERRWEQTQAQMAQVNARMDATLERMDRTEREIHAIAQAMMTMAQRMDARLSAVEQAVKPAPAP
jgi:hypothetical protein